MPSPWEQLIKAALIGTEKTAVDASALAAPVRARMAGSNPADRESYFYKAAALTYIYEKAGQMPPTLPVTAVQAPALEPNICPPPVQKLIERILRDTAHRALLLPWCFHKLLTKHQLLSPELIVPVALVCQQPTFKHLHPMLQKLGGSRGAWMVRFNPRWKFFTSLRSEALRWSDGSHAERMAWLREIRQDNPEKAFVYTQQGWREDENNKIRYDLLSVLLQQPRPEESDFATTIIDSLPAGNNPSAKPIHREMRLMAAGIILANPDSAWSRELTSYLKTLVQQKKGVMGIGAKTLLQVPLKSDAYLNVDTCCAQFGFDPDSPEPLVPVEAAWFSELIRRAHPLIWERVFDTASWSDILSIIAAAENITPKFKIPLLPALAQAIGSTAYRPAAQAWIKKYPVEPSGASILQHLSETELENCALQILPADFPEFLQDALQRPGWIWSNRLTEKVLEYSQKARKNGIQYQDVQRLLRLSLHFHPDCYGKVKAYSQDRTETWQQHTLQNQLFIPMLRLLDYRYDIERLIT